MYCDAPLIPNLSAVFKNRSVTCYWQEHGINVIPSFNGADAQSFDYCLTGLPKHSVLSTGNVGVKHSKVTTKLWIELVEKAIKELEPLALIIYGEKIIFPSINKIKVLWFDDFIHTRLKKHNTNNF